MNADEKVAALEDLLARVKRNAALPRTTGAAMTAAPEAEEFEEVGDDMEIEELDLDEEDIVDLTDDEAEAAELAAAGEEPSAAAPAAEAQAEMAADEVDIDFDDVEDTAAEPEVEPPASSRRAKAPSSMDEALASAAEAEDEGREVPLKTPPPESGRQVAGPPVPPQPPALDIAVEDDLEAPISAAPAGGGPTPEQLGQTVDLEEGPRAELELEQAVEGKAPAEADELEAPQPDASQPGAFSPELSPPESARAEIKRHREELGAEPAAQAEPSPAPPPAEVEPQVFERPAPPAGEVAAFAHAAGAFQPKTFVELLDASLELKAD